jgi:hypothetical protein
MPEKRNRNLFASLTFAERSELAKRLDRMACKVREVYFDGEKFWSTQDGLPTHSWWTELNRLESEVAAWADDWREFSWL